MQIWRELGSKKSLREKKELSTVKLVGDRLYINGHLNDSESYDSDTSDCDPVKVEPMDYPEAVRDWTHFGNALIHAPKNPRPQRSG